MEIISSLIERVKWLLKRKAPGELPPWTVLPGKKHRKVRPIDVAGKIVRNMVEREDAGRALDGAYITVAVHPELTSHQLADGFRSFIRRERKNAGSPFGIFKVKCHIIDSEAVRVTLLKEIPF